ncbi:MaoC/PaaZ C-terminal domain-containing protein [Streptomyces sp. NPDC050560]|uniref:MaoC/PaaZ C-terminal domain-containing protein n=1 Tax=Streptomyces sp. NPDC050560 TaxID=3365630 RepID=UPI00378EE3A1
MPLDPAAALAAAPRRTALAWEPRDVQLYHLGIGAGRAATAPGELRYVLEDRLRVLPAFATVAGGAGVLGALDVPGVAVDTARVLHGGQRLTLHRPLPARGRAEAASRITAVYDKGKAAVLVSRTDVRDAGGPLWSAETDFYAPGEGGFGGERGPSLGPDDPPDAPADRVFETLVRPDQALLYRLSGDLNPLHADPEAARGAGFERPILHGLCTYGMVLKGCLDGAPETPDGAHARVVAYRARFTGVVFPGETLRVSVWADGHVRARVPERGDEVLVGRVETGPGAEA